MLLTTVLAGVARLEKVEFDPEKVTPGIIGFAFTGIVALAVIFLLFDMNRRVRRMNYRLQLQDELNAEVEAMNAATAADAPAPAETAPAAAADEPAVDAPGPQTDR